MHPQKAPGASQSEIKAAEVKVEKSVENKFAPSSKNRIKKGRRRVNSSQPTEQCHVEQTNKCNKRARQRQLGKRGKRGKRCEKWQATRRK